MSKNSNPARLNIQDLPRDPQRCLGPLRQTLVASTNYCKRYPKKLDVLMSVLKAVYKYCLEAKQANEAAEAAKAKAEALALEEAEKAAEAESALLALKEKQDADKSA